MQGPLGRGRFRASWLRCSVESAPRLASSREDHLIGAALKALVLLLFEKFERRWATAPKPTGEV